MEKTTRRSKALAGLMLAAGMLWAAPAAEAAVKAWLPTGPGGGVVLCTTLSDNGQWGLCSTAGDDNQDNPQPVGGTLLNIATGECFNIAGGPRYGIAAVGDVTDDGSIVVGSFDNKPGYWTRATGEWTSLPLVSGYNQGQVLYVTPDGARALGVCTKSSDFYAAIPVVYDLATASVIDTPDLPFKGLNKHNYGQNAPHGLAADGKSFVGMVAESYLMDYETGEPTDTGAVMWAYVYNIDEGTYEPVGYTLDKETMTFTPDYQYTNMFDGVRMSPSGEWLTGALRVINGEDGTIPYIFHVPSRTLTVYDEGDDTAEMAGMAIDNAGNLYTAQPWDNPYPTAYVRHGKYFYPFDQIWSQVMDFSLISAIGADGDISGRVASVSADGLTMAMVNGNGIGYLLKLDRNMADAAADVDLLGTWTAKPADGSIMSQIKSVTVTFDRKIALAANPRRISLVDDETGATLLNALSSTQVTEGRTLSIGLVTTDLEPDKTYTLTIPAGMINIAGDAMTTNREIKIHYTGRRSGPVQMIDVYPSEGSSQDQINNTDSPVIITFDASVALNPEAGNIYLYENDSDVAKATVNAGIYKDDPAKVVLFTAAAQYMMKGQTYRFVIPAGFVTDVAGGGGCEEIVITYTGTHVHEIPAEGTEIFRADGNTDSFQWFMTFDGDLLTPTQEVADWGFTEAAAWWGVTDNSGDRAFASHSMYNPAGTSNDWLVSPQLNLNGDGFFLAFDAQSYRNDKADRLDVYVWPCDEGYYALDAEAIARIRQEATLVFSEQLTPGESEVELAGDWTNYSIDLSNFNGKQVYIAFVNENTDQSAIFIDNIVVGRQMDFQTVFTHATRVVGAESAPVSGRVRITSETGSFSSMGLRLLDATGAEVEALPTLEGEFTNGYEREFAFSRELPLALGETNTFTLEVTLDGVPTNVGGQILNLTFEPVRRVSVEEWSGRRCSNCPLGFLGMEKLEQMFPGQVIPIVLRGFEGDVLGNDVQGYASYLQANAAPAAIVDRKPGWIYPAYSVGSTYYFKGYETGLEETPYLWFDSVSDEIQTPAEASVEFAVNYTEATREVSVPIAVTYALNATDKALRLFGVILEDGVETVQLNGLATLAPTPELEPWAGNDQYMNVTIDGLARTTMGLTYSGTADLLPSTFVAGQVYEATLSAKLPTTIEDPANAKVAVMLIDGTTGLVVNANVARLGSSTGLAVAEGVTAPAVTIALEGGVVTARGKGNVALEAWTPAGILLGRTAANGCASLRPAAKGVVIVRATAADGSAAVAKLVL